jgi:hypothetical protein
MRVTGLHQIAFSGLQDNAGTRRQVREFIRIWRRARAVLAAKGLGNVAQCIDVVLTTKRGYYARYWQDGILCINLRDFLNERDPVGTLVHELGHRVWFRAMRKQTRMRWALDHNARMAGKLTRSGNFPSEYAKEAPIEDHAENFRMHVQGRLKGAARARYARLGPDTRKIRARLERRSHAA